MNPISAAQAEWEAATTPHPLMRPATRREPPVEEPFRKYGEAIAWITWSDNCELTKIETLRAHSGAPKALLSFLKSLARKHGIRIYGNPLVYKPTNPQAAASPLTQEQLEAWYVKQDFIVAVSIRGNFPFFWYPDVPED